MISNFRLVLNVVCFLLGNSPVSEIQTPGNYPDESIHPKHFLKLSGFITAILMNIQVLCDTDCYKITDAHKNGITFIYKKQAVQDESCNRTLWSL